MYKPVSFYKMVIPVLLTVLFLVSLLSVFKAPTYHLWLLAIAVTAYPLLFTGFTALLLSLGIIIQKNQIVILLPGILAFLLFLSPIVRAYKVASTLKENFNTEFGPGSTMVKGDNTHPPFSIFNLFAAKPTQVIYKTFIYSKENNLSLDFFPSRFAGKKPCVIVIHGGSWSSGDSRQLPELNNYLANAGFHVAAVNYRLAPKYQSPAAINDIAEAYKYLHDHADSLHIDTSNFVLLGRSAGAQIALLAAYSLKLPGLKGVVDFYGPADMVWGYSLPASKLVMNSRAVMEHYLGGTYSAVPQKYAASSPIEFVNNQSVPTLLIHGDNDVLVAPGHSQRLSEKLKQNHIKYFYLDLPWATHGFDYNINGPGGQLSTYVTERFLNVVCKSR